MQYRKRNPQMHTCYNEVISMCPSTLIYLRHAKTRLQNKSEDISFVAAKEISDIIVLHHNSNLNHTVLSIMFKLLFTITNCSFAA